MGGAPPTTAAIGLLWNWREGRNEVEEPYQNHTTVLTAKASKGDIAIEVTDPR